ncbi:MAG: VCBS domain-containing protein, partial [Cyanobium sp. LacPavin_0920_WC12_MAG_62_9]|nr:VCBS domain-containing protein [Cyanobium sp. LacPavin_0920_WC12_MAG_62_9]
SGTLSASDLDAGATRTWSFSGTPSTTYGTIAIDASTGVWTYTLDNSKAQTQALSEGQSVTETFSARVTDDKGAYADQTITVTIDGTNDRPVVTSTNADQVGSVRESGHFDNGDVDAGIASVSGMLSANDADGGARQTWSIAGTPSSTYGSIAIDPSTGEWTYSLDNSKDATQALKEGDSVSEIFTGRITDEFGAYVDQTITVTISGTNDRPTVSTISPVVLTSIGSSAYSGSAADSSAGNVYIQENPSGSTGTVSHWKFYKPHGSEGLWVTPVIYEKTGANSYEIRGIGRSRSATGPAGVYTFDFELVEGSALFVNGNYTYGHIDKNLNNSSAAQGTSSTGSISWGASRGSWGFINTQNPATTVGSSQSLGYQTERNYASELILSSGGSTSGLVGSVVEAGSSDDGSVVLGTSSVSGTLAASDVDSGATRTWSIEGPSSTTYGAISINASTGVWTYSLDNSKAATQALTEGDFVTESYTVRVTDDFGAFDDQTITVTIKGTNDAPVVTSSAADRAGTVVEAGDNGQGQPFSGTPSISGTLTASDADTGATRTWSLAGEQSTTYGSIQIDPSTGVWTYTLDNSLPATQALAEGQTVIETYIARATDDFGAYVDQTITVTINGSNDLPTVTNGSESLAGSVLEAGNLDDGTSSVGTGSVSGTLAASDVDSGATSIWTITGTPSTTYGSIAIDASTGVWTYSLDNSKAATQALKEGESVDESFTARITDDFGAFVDQTINVTINGTNDVPVATSTAATRAGTVVEAGHSRADTGSRGSSLSRLLLTNSAQDAKLLDGDLVLTFKQASSNYVSLRSTVAELLAVGGGASGAWAGNLAGGGGGGGGVAYTSTFNLLPAIYSITIGSGGIASGYGTYSTANTLHNGGSTSITSPSTSQSLTVEGGGVGGGNGGDVGSAGGSGGGGHWSIGTGGAAVSGSVSNIEGVTFYGNQGGESNKVGWGVNPSGGGGGGASSAGSNANGVVGGNGGEGLMFSTTGSPIVYGSGGGGAGPGSSGNGGTNAGNASSSNAIAATGGVQNTGAGGGAGAHSSLSGAGGSGVVVLRFDARLDLGRYVNDPFVVEDFSVSTGAFALPVVSASPLLLRLDGVSVSGNSSQIVDAFGVFSLDLFDGSYQFDPNDAFINSLTEDVVLSYVISLGDEDSISDALLYQVTLLSASAPSSTPGTSTSPINDQGSTFAGTSSVSGTLTASDVDAGATLTWSLAGEQSTTYGSIGIDASTGVWTYTLDNSLPATQALAEGQTVTETYTARSTDDFGAYVDQTVTVTINGSNDQPTVTNGSEALAGSVLEAGNLDDGTSFAGTGSVSGTLVASDVDRGATRTWSIAGTPSTTYGSIAIDASTGVWTFSLDNTKAATQALKEGESVSETFTARITDDFGASVDQTITITINGTNDVPVVSSSPADRGGTVVEAGYNDKGRVFPGTSSISGILTASDVDNVATRIWSLTGPQSTTYGSIAIDASTGELT